MTERGRLGVAKNWPSAPESRAKSWEDHSPAAQSRLVSALRDGAPQSGKDSAPLDSKHKGYGLTTPMTAAQQWTKLRNPLESIPICWPRGADAEQSSLSSLEMPRRDLIPEQRVCAGSATLGAPQVQGGTLEFNIGPLQAADLRRLASRAGRRPGATALSRWPQRLRLAASMSFSTSRSVRCSRGRRSVLGRRLGVTVRFCCCWRDQSECSDLPCD